jgi:hypothetical protein
MDNERQEIEEEIIGSMLNGFFLTPLDILKPQNFHDPLHRKIFELIAKNYATEPIDPVNISRLYKQAYTPPMTYRITELSQKAILRSINKYCLILLEMDIREKFSGLMKSYEATSVQENDFESAAIWKQCIDHIVHPDSDVFLAVDQIYQYIKSLKPDEVDEYAEMMQAIPKMIDRIRRQAQVAHLMDTLKGHGIDKGGREDMLRITIDIFLCLLVQSHIPPDLKSYLHHIQDHILCQSHPA